MLVLLLEMVVAHFVINRDVTLHGMSVPSGHTLFLSKEWIHYSAI